VDRKLGSFTFAATGNRVLSLTMDIPSSPLTDDFAVLQQAVRGRLPGLYRGVVMDNNDSNGGTARLQVTIPGLLGSSLTVWAKACVPYAGPSVGFYSLPPVGAQVWIAFEAGLISHPVWIGCCWGSGDLPDTTGPTIKIWKTDKVTIKIDDANDQVEISTTSGTKITLASDAKTESGGATLTVGSAGITSEKGAGKIEVTDSSVSINSGAFEVM
jgi:uncharacterized protein involved in type VI secretion and phage assembly